MTERKIMYVCASCAEGNPEGCGHFETDALGVCPNGDWICQGCFEAADYEGDWNDLPSPPAYGPISPAD